MLKRILTTLFAAAVMSVVCVAAELNGKGIKSDPYVIGTADDFCEFARLVNSGEAGRAFAVLTNDIDFENTEYTVVGNRNNPFCGNFNANGFAVKNVTLSTISEEYINSDGEADIGLFGAVKGAEISGLTAQNINISIMPEDDVGNSLSVLNVGILAGYCMYDDRHTDAVVSDCEVSGSITVGNGKVRCRIGGVVGTVYSRTVGSSFFLNRVASHVKTESYTKSFCFAGGVVGNVDISAVMASCGIREVYSGGSVVSSSECSLPLLGGIIGYALCESEWAGLSEETDKKSTDKETNVKDCFSDCSIENQKKNGYSGSTCGYSLSLKSENVFCSSDKYYCTNSEYSSGAQTVARADADKNFFESKLGWNCGKLWSISESYIGLRIPKAYDCNFSFDTSINGAALSAKFENVPVSFAVVCFFDYAGRLTGTAISDYSGEETVWFSAECENLPKYAKIVFFKSLGTFSPICRTVYVCT